MLNVALPKGRLGNQVYERLAKVGYECEGILGGDRRLMFENAEAGIRYFLVKPSDVATYVERGAADVGIVGKDVLLESGAEVFELLDLGLGKCRMAVAAKNGFVEDKTAVLRVATKYPKIAKQYFNSKNRDIEIIKLNGSIELAPLFGLSDVIVDIVETGSTLKENDLSVIREIMDISARFIANKAAYRFKQQEIERITERLSMAGEAK